MPNPVEASPYVLCNGRRQDQTWNRKIQVQRFFGASRRSASIAARLIGFDSLNLIGTAYQGHNIIRGCCIFYIVVVPSCAFLEVGPAKWESVVVNLEIRCTKVREMQRHGSGRHTINHLATMTLQAIGSVCKPHDTASLQVRLRRANQLSIPEPPRKQTLYLVTSLIYLQRPLSSNTLMPALTAWSRPRRHPVASTRRASRYPPSPCIPPKISPLPGRT